MRRQDKIDLKLDILAILQGFVIGFGLTIIHLF